MEWIVTHKACVCTLCLQHHQHMQDGIQLSMLCCCCPLLLPTAAAAAAVLQLKKLMEDHPWLADVVVGDSTPGLWSDQDLAKLTPQQQVCVRLGAHAAVVPACSQVLRLRQMGWQQQRQQG